MAINVWGELAFKLWGDVPGDRYILGIPRPGKGRGKEWSFKTTEDALGFVEGNLWRQNCVFFSQALFVPDTSREQANALTVRSFWMDLDVDPASDKKYQTQDDAKVALAEFVTRIGLPVPTLVNSGTGVQAHWILADRIDRERWQRSADALKNAAKRLGLKQDTTRTADIASYMRLPGTIHLKDVNNPRPVQMFGDIQPDIPVEDFERAVVPYIVLNQARIANKVFDVNFPKRPNDANKIADQCGVIAAVRDTRGCVPEPIWMHTLQLLNHCVDGEKYAHEWSNGHPDYSEDACQDKFESKSELGPTLCSTFDDKWVGESPCKVCPHYGKITSPIQLGATVTPAFTDVQRIDVDPKPQVLQSETQDDDLYKPKGYEVGREGVWFHDDDTEKDKFVLGIPLLLEKKDKSIHGGGTVATFKWQRSTGTIERDTIGVGELADLKTVAKWLFDNDITEFSVRNVELVRDYMQACIARYSQRNDPGFFHERLGWTPESHPQQGFVLGDRLITAEGVVVAKLNEDRVIPAIAKGFGESGTVEGWTSATSYISDARYMPHQFTLLMMIASPLFELVGFHASVISLVGKTGLGKSTSAYLGMSFFGVDVASTDSKALEIGAGSSEKSFRERWALAHNLPCLIDEAHTIKQRKTDIGQLIYDAANGTMRDTLRRNSTLRATDNWNLVTVLGCNSPMLDHSAETLPDAARKRVFEFNLGREHEIKKPDAVAIYRTLKQHYGVAGRMYLQEVVRLKEYIQSQEDAIKDSYAASDLPSDYRFMLWNVGVARLAGEICERLNLLHFDYRKPVAWAAQIIEQYAANEIEPVEHVAELLSEYERTHQSKFTVIRDEASWLLNQVQGECAGRYDRAAGGQWTLSIPKKVFQAWVRERGCDKHALKDWEDKYDVRSTNVKLTAIMGTTWCYVIPVAGDNL